MKVTLIYPRFDYPYKRWIPPLGLQYIAAALKSKYDANITLIDMIFPGSFESLKREIFGSDLICISATTPLAGRAFKVARLIKETDPDVPIVGGGPHATLFPEDFLKNGFDAVVIGEGEKTIIDLTQALLTGSDLMGIDGIALVEDGAVKYTKPREFVRNLDEIPFPARDLFDWRAYGSTVTLITSRGCPFKCSFCKPMQDKLFGRVTRRRSVLNVIKEIEQIKYELNCSRLEFLDDTFTSHRGWMMEFANEMIKRDLDVSWECNSRIDRVDEVLLRFMKKAGCTNITFGVESGSQKILDFLNKGIKVEDTVRTFKACHSVGVSAGAFIITGTPTETKGDLEATTKFIKTIRPSGVRVSRLTPLPGSNIYNYAKEHNIMNISEYDDFDYNATIYPLKLEHLTKDDLDYYEMKMERLAFAGRLRTMFESITNPYKVREALKNPRLIVSFLRTHYILLESMFLGRGYKYK